MELYLHAKNQYSSLSNCLDVCECLVMPTTLSYYISLIYHDQFEVSRYSSLKNPGFRLVEIIFTRSLKTKFSGP